MVFWGGARLHKTLREGVGGGKSILCRVDKQFVEIKHELSENTYYRKYVNIQFPDLGNQFKLLPYT